LLGATARKKKNCNEMIPPADCSDSSAVKQNNKLFFMHFAFSFCLRGWSCQQEPFRNFCRLTDWGKNVQQASAAGSPAGA
jgi:hypothetical protein